VVLNPSDEGRKVCEALLSRHVARFTGSELKAQLERPCQLDPLPEPNGTGGEGVYHLVSERKITDVDLVLLMPQEPADAKALGEATVTDFSAIGTRADCERRLAQMQGLWAQEQAKADESAREWIQGQLRQQEVNAAQACEKIQTVTSRCASLGGEDVKSACRGSEKIKRCRAARDRAFDRVRCEVEQESARRTCESERAILDQLRKRTEALLSETKTNAGTAKCMAGPSALPSTAEEGRADDQPRSEAEDSARQVSAQVEASMTEFLAYSERVHAIMREYGKDCDLAADSTGRCR
jgi:hypothetical protein